MRCDGCGHHVDESMSMDGFRLYEAEPLVCHACAARDMSRDRYAKDDGDQAGIKWRVFRRKGIR